MVPEKGLTLLTDVLDELRSPWRVLFIGSGPMRSTIEEWAKKYPDHVRFVSPTHDEVPAYLSGGHSLCAQPDDVQLERAVWQMVIKGFACGLAVVGSDSGEIPHVIGDAGIVVGEKDVAGWVRTLDRLIEDPELRTDLSQRGRVRAEEHFAWPVIARQHIEFFEQLLGNDDAASSIDVS